MRSLIYVIVQLSAIAYIIATGRVVPRQPLLAALVLLGFAILIWAVVTLRFRNLNVAPDVRTDGSLITNGPYRWVRHPMYTGALIVTLAWVANDFGWLRLVAWAALAADVLLKSRYEEQLLSHVFPGYDEYVRKTKRLIPSIY